MQNSDLPVVELSMTLSQKAAPGWLLRLVDEEELDFPADEEELLDFPADEEELLDFADDEEELLFDELEGLLAAEELLDFFDAFDFGKTASEDIEAVSLEDCS